MKVLLWWYDIQAASYHPYIIQNENKLYILAMLSYPARLIYPSFFSIKVFYLSQFLICPGF